MAKNNVSIGAYLAVLVTLIDQASKELFREILADHLPYMRISPYLNFRLSWNKGVTFGLLNDFGEWMPYVIIAGTLVILFLLYSWLCRSTSLLSAFGLGMVMGGAVGNVIDRLRFGAVVDFIDFHYIDYHWYTFNLADSAIVVGVGLLLLESFLLRHEKE